MFARIVTINLRPNSATEFTQLIQNEVLPLLRNENGFQDGMTFLATGGTQAVAISLWGQREHADAYNRDTYPTVLKTLGKVVEGTPEVRTYDVSNSTAHMIGARVAARG